MDTGCSYLLNWLNKNILYYMIFLYFSEHVNGGFLQVKALYESAPLKRREMPDV